MKRLVCIVEGKGEIAALPNLCARILLELEAWNWVVDPDPIRQPRSRLVDERVTSPRRPIRDGTFHAALELALHSRKPDGLLVLCDSDDDCPVAWGTSANGCIESRCRGTAVMIVREYETWLLHGLQQAADLSVAVIETKRDAKGLLRRFIPGYQPTLHQLRVTRELDIARCRARSDSFDKLVRDLAALTGVIAPPRPIA
jgi:hypothetical protein